MPKSKIEWTEFTWNPVTGCNKISPGCKNCYAESIANRFWKDRKFTDVVCHEDRLNQPATLKKPRMIFVNSMSDLFHESVPFEFIEKCVNIMATNPQHTYQILTKRPERLLQYCKWQSDKIKQSGYGDGFEFPDFMWIGVSVENQKTADERIPLLLQTPAKIRWLSVEPLLEPINLDAPQMFLDLIRDRNIISWIVIGCESGPNKRECKIEWVHSIAHQGEYAVIPVFVKQVNINGRVVKDITLFPEHLRIREYPQ